MDYLFVYGTLRSDHGGRASRMLADRAHYVDHATAPGRLYKIDWYPGMVEAATGIDRVVGEVFAFTDESLLELLDRFEAVSPAGDETGEFRRERVAVQLRSPKPWEASERETWVYLFNGPVEEETRIHSGDFIRYRQELAGADSADS